jgi:heterodisulfide reductase subunit A-like polyferredoxin
VKQLRCDVLVIGGGVAGVSAAVAAARNGAETMLVERESYLGGTGVAGMFQYMCGLYVNARFFPQETLNGGIVEEIVERLKKAIPESRIKKIGRVYVLSYSHRGLQSVLNDLCGAEALLTVCRTSIATAVDANAGVIRTVTVEDAGGKNDIIPKVVIDCTGDGNAAAAAGAEFELTPP